jgi:septal ring factor EnvC (AmiA/AmiB activator)
MSKNRNHQHAGQADEFDLSALDEPLSSRQAAEDDGQYGDEDYESEEAEIYESDHSYDDYDDLQDPVDDDDDDTDHSETSEFDDLANATEALLSDNEDEDTVNKTSRVPQVKRRRNTRQRQGDEPRGGGKFLVFCGGIMMLAGFALAVLGVAAPGRLQDAIKTLETVGLTPGLMITLGTLLALVARLQIHQQGIGQRLSELEESIEANDEFCGESLEFLVDAQEQSDSRRPASGEELDQVLHTLARQDEKVNNLTKALKMYGKPLVEVSRHVSDVAARVKNSSAQIAAIATTLESLQNVKDQFGTETQRVIDEVGALVAAVPTDNGSEKITRVLKALGTQIEKDLTALRAALPEANGYDRMQELLGNLGKQLATEVAQLRGTIDQNGDHTEVLETVKQLGTLLSKELERGAAGETLKHLESEIGTLQEAMRNLTSTVSASASAASAAAQAQAQMPAPAATASARPSAPAPAAAARPANPAPGATPSGAKDKKAEGPGGLAQSIAGETRSKSVMGAIAKLRKMRP